MGKSSPAARAALNFHASEHHYKWAAKTNHLSSREAAKDIACACYLKGLKILNEESEQIEPLDFLRLCAQEQLILIQHIIP